MDEKAEKDMERPAKPRSGLRSRRKKRTTDRIRKVAIGLVEQRGLDNVTVEMIADAAGISLRSFFNYFGFKEEALIPPPLGFSPEASEAFIAGKGALVDDLLDLVAGHLSEVEPDHREMAIVMQLADRNPRLLAVRERTFEQYEAEFRALVARRMGLGEDDREPQLLAAVLGAAFRVAMQRWVSAPGCSLIDELRKSLFALPRLFKAEKRVDSAD